ncbi:MAG: hypothetical protein KAG66_16470, partial [Methylococcales bacterium]|nr:hypothetical protein [Methylococcales bacterium]
VLHVQRMVNTVRLESGSCAFVVMSSDAYSWYLKSLMSVKYKDLRDTTMRTPQVLSASLLETMQNAGAVTHVGFVLEQSGISPVPIFINNSTYVDRSSGVLRKYAPEGHVLAMPPKSNGLVFAARILHPLARYEAKRLWINTWTDAKTGLREWELHSSILVAPANPKAMVSWRVCSTAYQGE